jgi:hypothetical protein
LTIGCYFKNPVALTFIRLYSYYWMVVAALFSKVCDKFGKLVVEGTLISCTYLNVHVFYCLCFSWTFASGWVLNGESKTII